jgi:hypothetical protein
LRVNPNPRCRILDDDFEAGNEGRVCRELLDGSVVALVVEETPHVSLHLAPDRFEHTHGGQFCLGELP